MEIECLVRREGKTVMNIDKTKYVFMPLRAEADRHGMSTSVAEIDNDEHVKYLLTQSNFIPYDPKNRPENLDKEDPILGYKYQKHGDGYIVVAPKNKRPVERFAGANGWTDSPTGIVPFPSEMQADEWLREEVKMEGGDDPDEEETAPVNKGGRPKKTAQG